MEDDHIRRRSSFVRVAALLVLDGPINCVGSHKGPAVRSTIETAGARLLFLSPYSPDFNPMEMALAKLKAMLRKATERTVEGLWSAIGRLVDTVKPDPCANFFAATEYKPD